MDRLIAPNSVPFANADTAPASGTPQYATSGNPVTNTPATIAPAYAWNAMQDEIMNVILAAGLTPNRNAWNQLLTAIQTMLAAQAPGRWIARVIYNAAGTFTETPPAGATLALYDVNGGGGAGGGCAVTSSGQVSGGAGGAAGGRALKRVANPTTQTVIVGAAGVVATPAGTGGNGGSSSVGSLLSATGGTGGAFGTAGSGGAGIDTTGGVGTGGDINMRGMPGLGAIVFGALNFGRSGTGGSSPYGGGGPAVASVAGGNAAQGNAAGGGGGMALNTSGGAPLGGSATPGIVVIDYFS